MAEEAGKENLVLFGLTADQAAGSGGWYDPRWHYDNEMETRRSLGAIFDNHFGPNEPGIFEPNRKTLRGVGYYVRPAHLTSYAKTQEEVGLLYADRKSWLRLAILNVANSGKFSSDRAIGEYAAEIWNAQKCPVESCSDKALTPSR